MQSVTYWEAWSLWWSGQKVDGMRMWGVQILWWARIGKVMQFIGGLIVVLDLIGPERLRKFGVSTSNVAARIRKLIRSKPRSIFVFLLFSQGPAWGGFLMAVLSLRLLEAADLYETLEGNSPLLWTAVFVMVLTGSAFTVAAALNFHRIPKLLAAVFSQKNPGHPARWIAFAIIIGGFHFDLIAS